MAVLAAVLIGLAAVLLVGSLWLLWPVRKPTTRERVINRVGPARLLRGRVGVRRQAGFGLITALVFAVAGSVVALLANAASGTPSAGAALIAFTLISMEFSARAEPDGGEVPRADTQFAQAASGTSTSEGATQ